MIGFIMQIFVHYDLLGTAMDVQQLFRKHGHSKNKYAELVIIYSYAVYLGFVIFYFAFRPFAVLYIYTSEYECNEFDKKLFRIMLNWMYLANPFTM